MRTMQIDIKRLYANIPMSVVAETECEWKRNIASNDRSSPFVVMVFASYSIAN